MIREILKIVPQISMDDLRKMERTLSQRFGNVAKKFGKGLVNTLRGGGVIGAFTAVFSQLLNPLKETQDAIERTLKAGSDAATFAAQFNTTAGKLLKLEAFAGSKGLAPDELFTLLNKFQSALSDVNADPTKQSAVSAFRGRTDTADAFFDFIQNLQKLDPTTQRQVQEEIFGEKQILKAGDFLAANFAELAQAFAGFDTEALTRAAGNLDRVADKVDIQTQQRRLQDIVTKSPLISSGTADALNRSQLAELNRENQNIRNFNTLTEIDNSLKEIGQDIKSLITSVPEIIKGIQTIVRYTVDGWTRLFNLLKEIPFLKRFLGG